MNKIKLLTIATLLASTSAFATQFEEARDTCNTAHSVMAEFIFKAQETPNDYKAYTLFWVSIERGNPKWSLDQIWNLRVTADLAWELREFPIDETRKRLYSACMKREYAPADVTGFTSL